MNKKGQRAVIGLSLLVVVFMLFIAAFATIDPLKESLNIARNGTLNCPGTASFNQADYDNDTTAERMIRRPVCFVTGITMVYFIGAFIIATMVWLVHNWRGKKR